jgi:uncharacterized protein (DUF697 family)
MPAGSNYIQSEKKFRFPVINTAFSQWHDVWPCAFAGLINSSSLKKNFMHNIDRTTGEMGYEFSNEFSQEFNNENFENTELGQELENAFELGQEVAGEYAGEYNGELSGETQGEVFHETQEMELASELLNVSNEQEMEQFLGKLIRRAAGAVSRFAKSSAGRAIGGVLKSVAKKALPFAGRALGTFVGGPLGGAIGGKLGGWASNLFELELEGLSNEDREFEMARAYVRFAGNAVKRAARNPAYRYNPKQAVRGALTGAARRYAPGLLRRRRRSSYYPSSAQQMQPAQQMQSDGWDQSSGVDSNSSSGTWYREGNQIILTL